MKHIEKYFIQVLKIIMKHFKINIDFIETLLYNNVIDT